MVTREKPIKLRLRSDHARPVTVLIVDRHRGVSELIRRNIEPSGIRVLEAASGIEGIRLLGEHFVDLLLLDPSLPDVDVRAFLHHCRNLYPDQRIRVIFMSDDPPDRYLMRQFSVAACVLKPFDIRDLLERIDRVFKPRTENLSGPAASHRTIHKGKEPAR